MNPLHIATDHRCTRSPIIPTFFILAIILVVVSFMTPLTAAAQSTESDTEGGLFGPAAAADGVADAMLDALAHNQIGIIRSRAVSINFDQLATSAADFASGEVSASETFQLNLFDNVTYTAINTGIAPRDGGVPGYILGASPNWKSAM